jgi:FKBP-type peptidyl-prolyl cis-trans isomerase
MKRTTLATAILFTLLPVLSVSVRAAEPQAPAATAPAPAATDPAPAATAPAPAATAPAPAQIPAPADVAAPPADAPTTASGLASKVLTPGTGTVHPGPDDRVKVDYTGWTSDGKMFDSSIARGVPANFNLNKVIPGWTEGIQLMAAGEKVRLWVPEKLAYKGAHGFPAGTLVFDIELLEIVKQ